MKRPEHDRLRALRPVLAAAALGVAVFGLGWLARGRWDPHGGEDVDRRVTLRGLPLVSPLLDVELPEGYSVRHEPIPFKRRIKAFVDAQIASGKVQDVSVYYRDLLDGPWFGINLRRKYNPASLMKVPVMIAWLKRAQRDPGILRSTQTFEEASYPGRPLAATQPSIVDHGRYTIEELLGFMIAYSDNRAMWVLYRALPPAELSDVLDSMDVANEQDGAENSISVHGYSGFFRILFNASYLDREMSERALELLLQQRFRGIAGGVPEGVRVAAKFGEHLAGGEPGAEVQLHDFGIVYHPSGPYILGVMTVGHDREAQVDVIRRLSALVYEEVEKQRPLAQ